MSKEPYLKSENILADIPKVWKLTLKKLWLGGNWQTIFVSTTIDMTPLPVLPSGLKIP